MTVRSERSQVLGRGLAALIPQRAAGQPAPVDVPIARIRPNPRQPRRHFEVLSIRTTLFSSHPVKWLRAFAPAAWRLASLLRRIPGPSRGAFWKAWR